MARIRTIKPEFCSSASVARLSRDAQLFFLKLLTEVDDSGRILWIPKKLVGNLYPLDPEAEVDDIDRWGQELEGQDILRFYVVEGVRYAWFVNFLKHQVINRRTASRLPAPPGVVDAEDAKVRMQPKLIVEEGVTTAGGTSQFVPNPFSEKPNCPSHARTEKEFIGWSDGAGAANTGCTSATEAFTSGTGIPTSPRTRERRAPASCVGGRERDEAKTTSANVQNLPPPSRESEPPPPVLRTRGGVLEKHGLESRGTGKAHPLVEPNLRAFSCQVTEDSVSPHCTEIGTGEREMETGNPSLNPPSRRGRRVRFNPFTVALPPCLDSSEGQKIWHSWCEYRGRRLTADAVQFQFEILGRQRDPVASLRRSIAMGWSGIFDHEQGAAGGGRRAPLVLAEDLYSSLKEASA